MNTNTPHISAAEIAQRFREAGVDYSHRSIYRWLAKHGVRSYGPSQKCRFYNRAAFEAAFTSDMQPQLQPA